MLSAVFLTSTKFSLMTYNRANGLLVATLVELNSLSHTISHSCVQFFKSRTMSSARQTTLKLIRSYFASCSSTYGLPYRYNKHTGFHVTESKWELRLWKLNSFASALVGCFVVGRLIQYNVDSRVGIETQMYLRLMAPIHLIPLLCVQIPAWRSRHDIVNLAAQTEKFFVKSKQQNTFFSLCQY